jgi:hypothetical protein
MLEVTGLGNWARKEAEGRGRADAAVLGANDSSERANRERDPTSGVATINGARFLSRSSLLALASAPRPLPAPLLAPLPAPLPLPLPMPLPKRLPLLGRLRLLADSRMPSNDELDEAEFGN